MTKTKSTKRALLLSALSLLMCVSMLIGSTFAWFTDSVTSAGNTIQSGTLQVDLVDAQGNSLEGKVLEFVDQDDNDLWEPGCTYQLQEVYIKNAGNLALKYEIAINGITGDAKLLEAIEWIVTVDGVETKLANLKGNLAAGETSKAIVLSGHMKEEAGNEYQGLTVDGISVSVFATQDTVEADSFNNQYDKDAKYKISAFSVAEIETAITEGKDVVLMDDVTFSANDTSFNSGYKGNTGLTIDGTTFDGNDNTLTVEDANTTWSCAINPKSGTIKNVTVAGAFRGIFMSGANGDVYIENVTFDTVYTFNSDAGNKNYGVYFNNCVMNGWTSYSNCHKEVVFTDCTFTKGNSYAFLRAYNDTEFVNCRFDADANFEVQIKPEATATFENCYYGDTLITAENIATLGLLYETEASRVTVK